MLGSSYYSKAKDVNTLFIDFRNRPSCDNQSDSLKKIIKRIELKLGVDNNIYCSNLSNLNHDDIIKLMTNDSISVKKL